MVYVDSEALKDPGGHMMHHSAHVHTPWVPEDFQAVSFFGEKILWYPG